jgi:hypothetical protein
VIPKHTPSGFPSRGVGRGNDGMYFLVRKQPMPGVHTALQCLETAPICPSITLVQHDT